MAGTRPEATSPDLVEIHINVDENPLIERLLAERDRHQHIARLESKVRDILTDHGQTYVEIVCWPYNRPDQVFVIRVSTDGLVTTIRMDGLPSINIWLNAEQKHVAFGDPYSTNEVSYGDEGPRPYEGRAVDVTPTQTIIEVFNLLSNSKLNRTAAIR